MTWHTFEDRQSAVMSTRIRDTARKRGLEHDYVRVGWTTMVSVYCTDAEWMQLIAMSVDNSPFAQLEGSGL